jgi:hypothetical protein
VAPEHDASIGQERRSLRCVHQSTDVEPIVIGSDMVVNGEFLDEEKSLTIAHQFTDEIRHRGAEQNFIATLE